MRDGADIAVVIPALDEEQGIGAVIAAIPGWVDAIIVVDNGSRDRTAQVAARAGARVLQEPERGYGAACLRGIAAAEGADIIVFLDADFSDHPEEMAALVDPILSGACDMVIGSRVLGKAQRGALTPQQRFGNALACWLIARIWGVRYTDLGPFRAIRRTALARLGMRDRNYGWTVEMQVRAIEAGLAVREVPVSYRARIGTSKVSGTIRGSVLAGVKILTIIARHALARGRPGRMRA